MFLKFYCFILIQICILITKSESYFIKNCSYEYTVELKTSELLHNNSYLYNNDTLITPDLVHEYSFKILNNGTRINNVEPYKRGCICAIKKCMRFCSNQVIEFYNNYSSPDVDKGFTKTVTLANETSIEKHLIHDYYPIFGRVCKNNSIMLTPELNLKHEWTLYEDGTLRHHMVKRNLTLNEYCFDKNVLKDNKTFQSLNPIVCVKPGPWVQTYGLSISIPFFIIIIIIYSVLANLNNVRGKCFITYLLLMTLEYGLLSLYKIIGLEFTTITCQIFGYVLYYTAIAIFTWSCILCYDAWTTLTNIVPDQISFGKYSIVGCSVPLLLTLIKYSANYRTELLKPLDCLVINTTLESALVFFDLPGIIVSIYSLTSYVLILRYARQTKRDHRRYFRERQEEQLQRLMLYFRVVLLMGFEWIFITTSHLIRKFVSRNSPIFTIAIYMAYLVTILQGPLMFLIFICTSRVFQEIKKRCSKISSSVRMKFSRNVSITEERRRPAKISTREQNN